MNLRVLKSELALLDLAEQADYLRKRSSNVALRFLNAAEACFQDLATMPGMGQRFESDNPLYEDVRCFPISKFSAWIVYYKPIADGILIVRVLHGARDVGAVFGQEDEL